MVTPLSSKAPSAPGASTGSRSTGPTRGSGVIVNRARAIEAQPDSSRLLANRSQSSAPRWSSAGSAEWVRAHGTTPAVDPTSPRRRHCPRPAATSELDLVAVLGEQLGALRHVHA